MAHKQEHTVASCAVLNASQNLGCLKMVVGQQVGVYWPCADTCSFSDLVYIHLRVLLIAEWPGRWRAGGEESCECSLHNRRRRGGQPRPSLTAPRCLSGVPPDGVQGEGKGVKDGERGSCVHLLQVDKNPTGCSHNDIRFL